MRNWIAKLLKLPTEAQLEAHVNTTAWMVDAFAETATLANQVEPITADRLTDLGACDDQVALFRELFPKGAPLTVEIAIEVAELFHWGWAARNLLSAPARKAYREATAAARKAFDEATAAARKAYDEAKNAPQKAYREATAAARKAYREATAAARKAYDEAKNAPQKAYREAQAVAFATAYLSQS